MLKIQEFIDSFDSILDAVIYLRARLQIESSTHTVEDRGSRHNLLLLKPGHRADMTNPLVQEANCLMLDDMGDVMAKAYDHPIVASESSLLPDAFDLSGAICEEIADGDMVVIYNIEGTWFIGTGGDVSEIKRCLCRSWTSWDKPFENMNPLMCFVFNYVSPYYAKIMPILTPTMYLTSVVNLDNDSELSNGMLDNLANRMDVARPNWNEINGNSSLSQRLLNMRALAPGLMLRDKHDLRVIIPNPIYKAVKCANDAGDRIRPTHIAKILEACRDKADVTSVAAAFDSYGPMLELLLSARSELIEEVIMLWSVARHATSALDFALAVQHHPLRYLLFMLRNEETTDLEEEVKAIKAIKLTRLTENKWEKEYDSASRLLKFAGGTDGDS